MRPVDCEVDFDAKNPQRNACRKFVTCRRKAWLQQARDRARGRVCAGTRGRTLACTRARGAGTHVRAGRHALHVRSAAQERARVAHSDRGRSPCELTTRPAPMPRGCRGRTRAGRTQAGEVRPRGKFATGAPMRPANSPAMPRDRARPVAIAAKRKPRDSRTRQATDARPRLSARSGAGHDRTQSAG